MEFIHPDIQQYAEDMTTAESPLLAELNRKTYLEVLYPRMLSGHLQGRMLAMFSQMIQPKRILEVGTYTGYSALCLAEGLQPGGKLITIDINAELEDMVMDYAEKAGFADRIDMRVGNAMEIVPTVEGPIDLVFLDADKSNYKNYFDLAFPNIRPGGFVLADNVLWSGDVLNAEKQDKETTGLRIFNEYIAGHDGVEQVLLPVRDGITVVRKK
mgnify:CR=1 FL=1